MQFNFDIGISEVLLSTILLGMVETRVRLQKVITEFCDHKDKNDD